MTSDSRAKLYLFSVLAVDSRRKTNHIEPNLLIDTSPQSAAYHALRAMKHKYPGCDDYQVGVIHEVPQGMIESIKTLL